MPATIVKTDGRAIVLDLSTGAKLCGEDIAGIDVAELGELINRTMTSAGTAFAFGRYAEPRELYSSDNFASDASTESRTIHMGIDLFCVADTPVFSPLDATVAFVANNTNELDYGPMVILRHKAKPATDSLRSMVTSAWRRWTGLARDSGFVPVNRLPRLAHRQRTETGRRTCTFS